MNVLHQSKYGFVGKKVCVMSATAGSQGAFKERSVGGVRPMQLGIV